MELTEGILTALRPRLAGTNTARLVEVEGGAVDATFLAPSGAQLEHIVIAADGFVTVVRD